MVESNKHAPGGKSNFSLDWSGSNTPTSNSNLGVKVKARRPDVQYATNNIFEE